MAILTVQDIDTSDAVTGLEPTFAAADAGLTDVFDNDGKTFFYIKNGAGSTMTVSFNSLQLSDHGFDNDYVIVVPATGETMVGPFPKPRFNDANGRVGASYTTDTSVTVAAIKLV